ncbi:MAG: FAD-binding protein [Nitrospinota bacterium]
MFSYERVSGWTLASHSMAHVARVTSREEIDNVLTEARRRGLSVTLRGSGYSYGDEILNEGGLILDLGRMNRILDWNPENGQMTVEPGVTYGQALACCLKDNWVISAVPGTRHPTLGGALANNVHGKNAWNEGNLGDSVVAFTLLTGNGEVYRCTREENSELFLAAIGGLGLLGVFLEIVLQCKCVPSPFLEVRKWTVPNLETLFRVMDALRVSTEYHVGWVDCFATGRSLGRGTLHAARFVERPKGRARRGEDLAVTSPSLLGLFPRTWLWPFLRPFFGNGFMRLVNTTKFHADRLASRQQPCVQNFFKFNFLLDSIPDWRQLYKPHGYVELFPLIPFGAAPEAFRELIELTQGYGAPSFLAGIKSHRRDDFLLSYSLDGYSLGIDVPAVDGLRARFDELFYRMTEIVLRSGGRIHLAKDDKLTPDHFRQMFPRWREFEVIKQKYDPESLFESGMYRRLFLGRTPSKPPASRGGGDGEGQWREDAGRRNAGSRFRSLRRVTGRPR